MFDAEGDVLVDSGEAKKVAWARSGEADLSGVIVGVAPESRSEIKIGNK